MMETITELNAYFEECEEDEVIDPRETLRLIILDILHTICVALQPVLKQFSKTVATIKSIFTRTR